MNLWMDLALVVIVFQLGFENEDAHKSTSLMLVTEGDGALLLFQLSTCMYCTGISLFIRIYVIFCS